MALGAGSSNPGVVSAGQEIALADISYLTFTPVANANGDSYANFTFQVKDDGGTTNGGVNTDQTPNTITIDVTSVNDAPDGADKTVTTNEDTAYTFTAADFGFSDTSDSPANNLLSVIINTLPSLGFLALGAGSSIPGVVSAGQEIALADISYLTFTPPANANGDSYANFTFQVKDDGGTSNSGVNTDQTPNTITIDVTSVNDAPQGLDNTITSTPDTGYTFATSDFGFSDPNDSPANNLQAVEITTLPTAGFLMNGGVEIMAAGTFVLASDIALGKLVYMPDEGATTETNYASFTFQVQDDGGTTNGGVNIDPTANTINIDIGVAPVVLDLNGDGIHLTSAATSSETLGQLSGTNNNQLVGWFTEGDGLLMLNSNGNGQITNINQISFTSYVPGAHTDLQGLIAFDTNHDGKLDSGDKQFNEFGVLLSNNKFESLSELGVTSISLTSDNQLQKMNGNTIFGFASFQTADGATHQAADVAFGIAKPASGATLQTNDVISNHNVIDFSSLPQSETNAPVSPASASIAAPLPPLVTESTQVNANLLPPAQIMGEQIQHQIHQDVAPA